MTSVKRLATGSRRRRYAAVLVPSLLLAGLTVGLVGQGALAASFAISGTNFKLSADRLEATGFASYSSVESTVDGKTVAVTPAGFTEAKLYGLCQSVVSPTPFGDVTMILRAGSGDNPVIAKNLVADFDSLQGDVTFNGYSSGVDASQLAGGAQGPAGSWGQQAQSATILNLKQNTWATTAATFILKGVKIDVSFDGKECF